MQRHPLFSNLSLELTKQLGEQSGRRTFDCYAPRCTDSWGKGTAHSLQIATEGTSGMGATMYWLASVGVELATIPHDE